MQLGTASAPSKGTQVLQLCATTARRLEKGNFFKNQGFRSDGEPMFSVVR
jgi:hypothetical protein